MYLISNWLYVTIKNYPYLLFRSYLLIRGHDTSLNQGIQIWLIIENKEKGNPLKSFPILRIFKFNCKNSCNNIIL